MTMKTRKVFIIISNVINRWRIGVALRTARRYGVDACILACGGDPAGTGRPEADLLVAELLRRGFVGALLVERESRTTLENARCVAPMLRQFSQVAVASHPLHALKLRICLAREDGRLRWCFVQAEDFRMGEWGMLRPITALVGVCDLLRVVFTARPVTAGVGASVGSSVV